MNIDITVLLPIIGVLVAVVAGFAVAYAAMFGFDKLREALGKGG